MPSLNNEVILASAGSRKTSYLVESALNDPSKKVLIVAYTINNLSQIKEYIVERNKCIPSNITIQSWHAFLLQDYIRPYQNSMYSDQRIESIYYPENLYEFNRTRRFIKKENVSKYYIVSGKYVISEKLSEFASLCNIASDGLVINRLVDMYDHIYIDEFQDLAGYALDVVEQVMLSDIKTILVGDCRQATFFSNCSPKYKKFKGANIIDLFKYWEKLEYCTIVERVECFRSNQIICDFSDDLYPDLPRTKSKFTETDKHEGIFTIKTDEVKGYIEKYNPVVLRHSRAIETLGDKKFNFGEVKGRTFNRVLIYPTGPIKKYLKSGNHAELKLVSKAKLYVAITRARLSVAFVYDKKPYFDE